ncbi:MAG TPA: hypothetical protein VGR35_18995 [Tepidisphaeraceae bacterium]|nr:hypothetical protein [Tepidisphaeraceae bacterium]
MSCLDTLFINSIWQRIRDYLFGRAVPVPVRSPARPAMKAIHPPA